MTDPNVPASLDVRPRTVVYIGNFRHPWCTEVHVALALSSLGCTVIRCQEDQVDWPGLARYVDDGAAELVIWQRSQKIDFAAALGALEDLRRAKVPVVSYHLDRWVGLDREHELAEHPFFRTDLVISPDGTPHGRWDQLDIRHYWMPPGVAAEETVIGQRSKQWADLDVVFVGSYPYPHPEWAPVRHALIEAFRAAFGKRFAVLPGRQAPIRNKALADLYATVPVVLGDSCLVGNVERYWSDRVPETLGRRGLLLHPWAGEGMAEWYPADGPEPTINYYRDPADAVDVARMYLKEPDLAEVTRTNGAELVRRRDTYAHRMAELLEYLDSPAFHTREPTPRRRRLNATFSANSRIGATFQVDDRDGVAAGVTEVWTANDYRLDARQIKAGVVIDIGANVGAFSVLAAKLGAREVHAYEPDPTNYRLLSENTRQAEGVVTCWPVAATFEAGAVLINHEGGGAFVTQAPPLGEIPGMLARGELDPNTRTAAADPLKDIVLRHCTADEVVPNFTPEEDAARLEWNIARQAARQAGEVDPGQWPDPVPRTVILGQVHLLKVDIEGGEYAAFASLDRRTLRRVKRIVLEFHGPGMPHLRHLTKGLPHEQGSDWAWIFDPQPERWGRLVALLASEGRLEVLGRPDVGGLIWWDRYDDPEPRWREEA